ncbi:MAG: twin-arginine translocase TatA/TatE family subunit [Candidatus Woesearchaeota archaeon]
MVGDLLQPTHLLFVLVVALLVLGPKRLPEVGRALGRGLRDFRSAISGEDPPERTIAPAEQPEASSSTPVHEPAAPSQPSSSTGQSGTNPSDTAREPEAPSGTADSATSSDAVTSAMRRDSAA